MQPRCLLKYKDYYQTLGLERSATVDDVKKAYRKLAHKYHPDVSKDLKGEEKFKEIAEAYATLKNTEKRQEYDDLGNRPAGENFTPPPEWQQRHGASDSSFDDVVLRRAENCPPLVKIQRAPTVMRQTIRKVSLLAAAVILSTAASARTPRGDGVIIPLYPKGEVPSLGVPEIRESFAQMGGLMIRNVSEPSLELFRPAPGRANGSAVIIAPGGGFVGLGYEAGGTVVARTLARHGVTAFVLKYRTIQSDPDPMQMPAVHLKEMDVIMARAKSGTPAEIPRFAGGAHAVEDGARALAIVRQRASEWGVDPRRVGFLGFSAGAYLAADLAIGDKASRPDFVALMYGGLRTPVPADASPAFIAAAADDEYQPNDAALLFNAWRRPGIIQDRVLDPSWAFTANEPAGGKRP